MKPKKEWKSAKTRDEMMGKNGGIAFSVATRPRRNYSTYAKRFNELMTGIRQVVAVKLYSGHDLDN